jgi:biotin carboxyl carrier protein
VLATIPSGWRNVPGGPQQVTFGCDGRQLTVRYRVGRDSVTAEVDGEAVAELVLRSAEPGLVVADLAGIRQEFSVTRSGPVYYVDSQLGATTLTELSRFPEPESVRSPGSLLAPMPGTVVRIEVAPGGAVAAGAPVVVLEAMKMEHTVVAPHDGAVTSVGVTAGQPVDVGTVLAVVEAQHDQ